MRIDSKCFGGFEDRSGKFECRISNLEKKMDFLMSTCSTILSTCEKILSKEKEEHDCCANLLLPKILYIDDYLRNLHKSFETDVLNENDGSSNPVVLVQSGKINSDDNLDPNVHILTLNNEGDIPEGSWLGDSTNPKARVRVDISPPLLTHINAHCTTPEKMALTLLDCLFPREVLAVSNVSGKGKHSKKQLDPLLIYAIRCHLVYKFNITDKDWHRIKQNIDSKCRAAWRKKISGMSSESSIYKAPLTLSEPLSEESSDGVTSITSIKVLRNSHKHDRLFNVQDKNSVKVFTDEELKDLLPTPVELFVDNECFSLGDQTLVVQECHDISEESPEKAMDDDNNIITAILQP